MAKCVVIDTEWVTNGKDVEKHYDRALILIQYYVNLVWLIFGAFLLTETVLLAGIASMAKHGPPQLVLGGALLGLILTVPWWCSFRYNHTLYLLHMAEAYNCEPEHGNFFHTGRELTMGKEFFDPLERRVIIPAVARWLHPSRSAIWLIRCFALVFLLLVIWVCTGKGEVKKTESTAPATISAPAVGAKP
jgi:hypothetical protein